VWQYLTENGSAAGIYAGLLPSQNPGHDRVCMGTADPDTKRQGLIISLLPEEALVLEVSQRVRGRSLVRGLVRGLGLAQG
jgi:hypothetical protein